MILRVFENVVVITVQSTFGSEVYLINIFLFKKLFLILMYQTI